MPVLGHNLTHPATMDPEALFRQVTESRDRASGPGGQHRNKVETRVTLTHQPSGITGAAGERRSQRDNRSKALFRLRLNLAVGIRASREAPSELWKSRCRNQRIQCNPTHKDFPAMLAEVLDFLAIFQWKPKPTVDVLGCTTSQLIKFLKQHRAAWELVNNSRKSSGLHPLK